MRAQLKKAYLDTNFPSKSKIISLVMAHGIQGKAAAYDLILLMSRSTNAVIDKNAFLYTAKINEVKDPEAFLAYCLKQRIFIEEMGGYSNTPVILDQESYGNLLEKDRNRKRKAEDIPLDSDIDIDNDIDLNNRLRLSGKFNTPEIREAVTKWRDKQRKQGRNYDQIQLDANCINFSTPERFLKALNFSLGLSKTFNIHEPPEKETKNGFTPKASTPAGESLHPALRAERDREAKAALERLGMGGLTK